MRGRQGAGLSRQGLELEDVSDEASAPPLYMIIFYRIKMGLSIAWERPDDALRKGKRGSLRKDVGSSMRWLDGLYRSFASLRMTWIRLVVILSEAKDLHTVSMNSAGQKCSHRVLEIPRVSVESLFWKDVFAGVALRRKVRPRARLPSPLGKVDFGGNACISAERRKRSLSLYKIKRNRGTVFFGRPARKPARPALLPDGERGFRLRLALRAALAGSASLRSALINFAPAHAACIRSFKGFLDAGRPCDGEQRWRCHFY